MPHFSLNRLTLAALTLLLSSLVTACGSGQVQVAGDGGSDGDVSEIIEEMEGDPETGDEDTADIDPDDDRADITDETDPGPGEEQDSDAVEEDEEVDMEAEEEVEMDFAACYQPGLDLPRLAPKYPGTWQTLHPYPLPPLVNPDGNGETWSSFRQNSRYSARIIEDDGALAIMMGDFPIIFDGDYWVRPFKPMRMPALLTLEDKIPYCDTPPPSEEYLSLFNMLRNTRNNEYFIYLYPFDGKGLLELQHDSFSYFLFKNNRWRQLSGMGVDGITMAWLDGPTHYGGKTLFSSGTAQLFWPLDNLVTGSYGLATIEGNELRLEYTQPTPEAELMQGSIHASQLLSAFTLDDNIYATDRWGRIVRYNHETSTWDTVLQMDPASEDGDSIYYHNIHKHVTLPDGRMLLFGYDYALESDDQGFHEVPFDNDETMLLGEVLSAHVIDNDTALLWGNAWPSLATYEDGVIHILGSSWPDDDYVSQRNLRILDIAELPTGEPVALSAMVVQPRSEPFRHPIDWPRYGTFSSEPPFIAMYYGCRWHMIPLPDFEEYDAMHNPVTGMTVWNATGSIAVASRMGILLYRNMNTIGEDTKDVADNWELHFPNVYGVRDVEVDPWGRLCAIGGYHNSNSVFCMDDQWQVHVLAPFNSMERLLQFNRTDHGLYILGEQEDSLYAVEEETVSKVSLEALPVECRHILQVDRRADGRGLLVPERHFTSGWCNGIGIWHEDDSITYLPHTPGDALDLLNQYASADNRPTGVMLADGTPYVVVQGGGYIPKKDSDGWRWESQLYEGYAYGDMHAWRPWLVRVGDHLYSIGLTRGTILEKHVSSRDQLDPMLVCADEAPLPPPNSAQDICTPSEPLTPVSCSGPKCAIPGGTYCLGEKWHRVEVTMDDFSMDKYEVTNLDYHLCVDAGVCTPPHETFAYPIEDYYGNPYYDAYPVVNVDAFQSQEYCQWKGGRLPTEFEWEAAAGAGSDNYYPWGDVTHMPDSPSIANAGHILGHMQAVDAAPGGITPFGVEQLVGNAAEWTMSNFPDDWNACRSGCDNPVGDIGNFRWLILRGCSWGGNVRHQDANHRYRYEMNGPEVYSSLYGFRCVYGGE